MGAGLRRPGAAEHHRCIGLIRSGDRRLFAIEDVFVADPLNLQAQIGRIRTAARLGQRDRQQRFARGQPCQPVVRDIRPAVVRKNLTIQRSEQVDVGHAEVGARDLFVDHSGREATQSQAAEMLRQFGRDETHRAHRLHQSAIENACLVAFLETRRDPIGSETPDLIAERNHVVVQIGVHWRLL
jgi:hypothetical protein